LLWFSVLTVQFHFFFHFLALTVQPNIPLLLPRLCDQTFRFFSGSPVQPNIPLLLPLLALAMRSNIPLLLWFPVLTVQPNAG
jgi:hypothetical protein